MIKLFARDTKRMIKRGLRSPFSLPIQWMYRGLGTCLMYHRICRNEDYPIDPDATGFFPNVELMVRVSDFDAHMGFIAKHYRCISVSQAVREIQTGTMQPRSLTVTFDDGSFDCLDLALPILRKHNVPATIYLATGIVDKTASLWWYEQEHIFRELTSLEFHWRGRAYAWNFDSTDHKLAAFRQINDLFKELSSLEQSNLMHIIRRGAPGVFSYADQCLTWDQIAELDQDPLITIGAHTHNHFVLSELSAYDARREIQDSRTLLESRLGHPVEHFAYPFGGEKQAGAREFELVRELGFKSGVTTRIGHLHPFHKNHVFSLPRIPVGYHDDLENFAWKLSGLEALIRNPSGKFFCG